jgi:hypothetical protein
LSGVQCFAQNIHFLVVTLLNLDLVHQLKGILQNMYDFFAHKFPKKFKEFWKLIDLMNLKENKHFQNVETKCISMLFLAK